MPYSPITAPTVLKETTGTLLRRLAKTAESTNPWWDGAYYMKSLPSWQPLTSYNPGGGGAVCVVSGGQIYYESYAGTSTGGFGPTTVNSNVTIGDGSMYWLWYAPNQVTQDPFVTITNWAQSTAYALNTEVYANGGIYACIGAATYKFTVSGVTVTPSANAIYTNNSQTFYVVATSIAAGSGTITAVGTGAPSASGTLTKTGGSGDATISFSAEVTATTSAASGTGPTGSGAAIVDNGIVWNYMGPNIANLYSAVMPQVTMSAGQPSGLTNIFYPNGNNNAGATANTNSKISILSVYPLNPGQGYAVGDTYTQALTTVSVINMAVGTTPGTGYAVGDIGYVSGGTYTKQAKYIITAAPGGIPSTVAIYDCGTYTVAPATTNAATTVLTGSGSGTLTLSQVYCPAPGIAVTPFQLNVTSINGSGGVTGLAVANPGNYTTAPLSRTQGIGAGSTSGSGAGMTFAGNFSMPPFIALRGAFNEGAGPYGDPRSLAGTFQTTANGQVQALHYTQDFYTDAAKFWVMGFTSANIWGIIIDGVRYSLAAPSNLSASSNIYCLFDFTTTGGRKKRHIQIDATSGTNFSGVGVSSLDTVWSPPNNDAFPAVIISDSIMSGSGYGPFIADNTVAFRLRDELGWNNITAYCEGGTGYVARGSTPGVSSDNFGYRVPQAVALNPKVIILTGSTNDSGQSSATITAAVTAVLTNIRALGSTAVIIVFGVWPAAATALTTENAVAAGVAGFTDPLGLTFFIPFYNRTDYPYITASYNNNPLPNGTYNTSATSGSIYVNTGDTIHPLDTGTEMLAKRMATDIKTLVLPNLL